MHIKGDKQLDELKKSVEVMSDKFDEFEKDHEEKEKIINSWKCIGLNVLKEH